MTTQKIEYIDRAKIHPDPEQPRRMFNEAKLAELAESIKADGIEQALKVRPHPKQAGHYFIIMGERRWRASEIAGLEQLPVVIDARDHDPIDLFERQLVENHQRDDLHPLEEGEAFAKLHKTFGRSIEDLMARHGKSRSHIYARIKLTELAAGVKKALLDGRLPPAHGELLGRIPDKKLQEQCLGEVLGEGKKGVRSLEDLGLHHETVNEKEERWGGKPQALSFRATAVLVRRRYQTNLSLATFEPGDATLTKAGACGPCEHRSGNQPELPGMDTGKDASKGDHCGNLVCFEAKTDAQWKRTAAAAEAEGIEVLEGKKAEALLYANGEPKSDSGYVALASDLPYDVSHRYENGLTWKKVLGKHAAELPKTIVRGDRGAPVEVFDKKAAVKLIETHGLIPKKKQTPASPSEKKFREKQAEGKAATKARRAAFIVLIGQAELAAAKGVPAGKEAMLWRFLAKAIARIFHYQEREYFAERRGISENDVDKEIDKLSEAKHVGDLRALVVELVLCKSAESVVDDFGDADEVMGLAGGLFGLDWKKAEAQAQAEHEHMLESAAASEMAKAEAKAAKPKKGAK